MWLGEGVGCEGEPGGWGVCTEVLFQAVGERAREEEDDITVVLDGPEHVDQMRAVGRCDSNAGRGLGPVKNGG
jgi:hypothetical protein